MNWFVLLLLIFACADANEWMSYMEHIELSIAKRRLIDKIVNADEPFNIVLDWRHDTTSVKTITFLKTHFRQVMDDIGKELCRTTRMSFFECDINSLTYSAEWVDQTKFYSPNGSMLRLVPVTTMYLRILREVPK